MIFKKIHIKNFQSHKNSVVEFTLGLNVLIGPTNAGKSAVLRALQKLIRDYPAGKDFINEDADSASIELTFERDNKEYKITRSITATKNLYYLSVENQEQEFGGFGREIPQEIQNALEMFLIELENTDEIDLHFLDQHDPLFMISKGSAGVRSKILGRVGGLHILDKGIVQVNKDTRQENSNLKIKVEEKEKIQNELNDFPNITIMEQIVEKLFNEYRKLKQQVDRKDLLKSYYNSLTPLAIKGKQLKTYIDSIPIINPNFNKIRQQIIYLEQIKMLNTKLLTLNVAIRNVENKIIPDIKTDFNLLRKKIIQLDNIKKLSNQLYQLNLKLSAINIEKLSREIEEKNREWVFLLRELKVCPTCKQTTTNVGEFYG